MNASPDPDSVKYPEWIEGQIPEIDPNRKLQYRSVIDLFVQSEQPFLTRQQVQYELKGQHSNDTVNSRLGDLCDMGLLKSYEAGLGHLYWLNHPDSDWPIPPDVHVKPVEKELTVSEFLELDSGRRTLIGVGAVLIGSVITWFGAILGGLNTQWLMPFGAVFLGFGLLITIGGWLAFASGFAMYLENQSDHFEKQVNKALN